MAELTGARWRKSTRSGDNGGNCVEVADMLAGLDDLRPHDRVNGEIVHYFTAYLTDAIADPSHLSMADGGGTRPVTRLVRRARGGGTMRFPGRLPSGPGSPTALGRSPAISASRKSVTSSAVGRTTPRPGRFRQSGSRPPGRRRPDRERPRRVRVLSRLLRSLDSVEMD